MVFSAVVNDINSLISLLIHYWCIEMQSTSAYWFYILRLSWIPVSILDVFWCSHSDFPWRVSCLWAGKDWFLLANLDTLYSFKCLNAEAKTSNSMVNNSAESGHPCRVPDLRGKAEFFTIEDDISCGTFMSGYSHVEAWYFYPSFHDISFFHQERMLLHFVKRLFCTYWEDHVVVILSFINVMYHISWFADIELVVHPRNKSNSLWWLIICMYCWIRFATLCW